MPHIKYLPSQLTAIEELPESPGWIKYPRTPYLRPTEVESGRISWDPSEDSENTDNDESENDDDQEYIPPVSLSESLLDPAEFALSPECDHWSDDDFDLINQVDVPETTLLPTQRLPVDQNASVPLGFTAINQDEDLTEILQDYQEAGPHTASPSDRLDLLTSAALLLTNDIEDPALQRGHKRACSDVSDDQSS